MTVSDDYPALRMLIDGEWIDAGDRRVHTVVNPATGAALGDLPLAHITDLERALEASARAFRIWRAAEAGERARVLREASALIRQREAQIARLATLEEGKTYAESLAEARASAALLQFFAGECERTYGRVLVRPPGRLSRVVSEPIGPVAAFAPWNFPIHNPARKLGPAVGAGCSVILKPAEEAPASAIAIVQCLVDAGLPPGVVQLVFGVPDEVSRTLLASPVVRKLSFTGSTVVGKHLMKLAADTCKRTTMELGGHAPVIVFDDADLEKAMDTLVAAKLRNSGQVCVSPTRFYVQEGVHDRFVEGMAARMRGVALGNGLEPASQMGPTANPRRPAALEAMLADAKAQGARVVLGGERLDRDGFFFQPTLLSEVPTAARVMNEEPFGPFVLVRPFSTFDEAVEQANRLPYGLAAYAFTENGRRANLIAEAIEAGMVGINMAAVAAADSPFGGVKESGHGSEDGLEGFADCLVAKAIHQA